jgi:hypothetical protein
MNIMAAIIVILKFFMIVGLKRQVNNYHNLVNYAFILAYWPYRQVILSNNL